MAIKTKVAEIQLRPYQATDINAIEAAFKKNNSLLYQLPTGGGKGVIITKLICDYKDDETIIFAHKKKLLKQIHANLAKIGIKAGLLMGSREENMDAKIVLVSIRSAVKAKRLEALINRPWKRGIIDEARHSRTGSYDLVLGRMRAVHPDYKLLGVDATPYRKDGKELSAHFQSMLVSCENIKSLQQKGYLAKIRTFATPIGEIKEKVKEVANDYQQTALSNYMRQPKFLNYIVDAYIKFDENRQAIVFAVDKAHSKDLLAKFKEKLPKIVVEQIDSDLSDDVIDKVYERYESKEIQILINVEMLIEGVDLPETGCIVGGRPTKSIALYLQMAGRGMRPKEDGSDLIIIDCAGWTEEFGSIEAERVWSLDPNVDPNGKQKKNRIVGKRKDGTLTTDVNEFDEFTELIEMTPEEYIGQVQGGLEEAKKENMKIEKSIEEVEKELAELIHEASVRSLKGKPSPYTSIIKQDDYGDNDNLTVYIFHSSRLTTKKKRKSDNEEDSWKEGTHIIKMELQKKSLMYATLEDGHKSDWGRRDVTTDSVEEIRNLSFICGDLNRQIIEDKSLMIKIVEKHAKIHELKKTKIDIKELENLKEKFKADKYQQAIVEHAAARKEFIFTEINSAWTYFKNVNGRIYGLRLKNDKITEYHNEIEILKSEGKNGYWEQKNYIKGDRVREIIKDGKWKPENN